jgi:Domain of unknown function (DUF4440)
MTFASEAELQIRLRRAAFNRALAEADLSFVGLILSPEVVLVTGTDSAVISGRKAQLAVWKREFGATPRTIYTRTTQSVVASPLEPIAMEHGHWQGVTDGSATIVAAGTYAAKWRRYDKAWLLVAEIFVTLA